MTDYIVTVSIGAGVNIPISADTPEDAAAAAMDHDHAQPALCHSCTPKIDLADPGGALVDLNGEEVYNDMPEELLRKENARLRTELQQSHQAREDMQAARDEYVTLACQRLMRISALEETLGQMETEEGQEITALRQELEAASDVASDMATTLDLVRQALGVPPEPHQGMAERILEELEQHTKEPSHA